MTIIDTTAPETNSVPLPSLAEQLRSVADELDRQAREAAKTSHPAFQSSDAKAEREANGRRVFVLANEADQERV